MPIFFQQQIICIRKRSLVGEIPFRNSKILQEKQVAALLTTTEINKAKKKIEKETKNSITNHVHL